MFYDYWNQLHDELCSTCHQCNDRFGNDLGVCIQHTGQCDYWTAGLGVQGRDYSMMECFRGVNHYLPYGTEASSKARFIYWASALEGAYKHRWTEEEIRYAKQQLDKAFEEVYGQ